MFLRGVHVTKERCKHTPYEVLMIYDVHSAIEVNLLSWLAHVEQLNTAQRHLDLFR
jgi:hypothetical protein